MPVSEPTLHCSLCGQAHRPTPIRPGQRATCVRCGTLMAEGGRLGQNGCLALAVTGLILCLPAVALPFVTLAKFGNERTVLLTDGFLGFWSQGFGLVGVIVLLAGTLAPVGLLGLLVAVQLAPRLHATKEVSATLHRWTERVEYWAMPEVQVLGVLVAFFKLGDIVDVAVGPGLYCYAAASFFTLLAWRCFKLTPRHRTGAPADARCP
jgi:paraquat-inducible protein A